MEKTEMKVHIRDHLDYPARKEDLVQACNNMAHVPAEDRKWFEEKLPSGTYKTSDDVLKTLGL